VTWEPFARVLVRKSQRALKVARLALNAGDSDSAVNRSYYAMLNVAQAALLSAGVAEDKLPRTHNGVSEAFRLHAVQSGLIDRQLASELSRTESLRIKADYTDLEIEPKTATESETGSASGRPYSLEEERRQARENWLRLRQQTTGARIATNRERGAGQDAKKDLGHAQDNDVDT